MASVVVALQGTVIDNADAVGNWDLLDSTKDAGAEPDFFYQRASGTDGAVSVKIGASSEDGLEYEHASTVDYTTGPKAVLILSMVANYAALDPLGSTGLQHRVGSDQTNYYEYYIHGNDTYPKAGGWIFTLIDPDRVGYRDAVVGTPSISAVDYYAVSAEFSAASKSENLIADQLLYITSGDALKLTRGDGTSTGGVWEDFVDFDEGTLANSYGLVRTIEGVLIVSGKLLIGESANPTTFNDSNKTLVWPDARIGAGVMGLEVNLENQTADIDFTNSAFVGNGRVVTKHFFDTALQVDSTADAVTVLGHGLDTGDYVVYSREGGTANMGLTETAANYFVRAVDDDTLAFYVTGATVGRQNAVSDTSRVNLTRDTAPGENHSVEKVDDTRPDLEVVGTSGAFNTSACTFNNWNNIKLTSGATIDGGFILSCGSISGADTGVVDGVGIQSATTPEGVALFPNLSQLNKIQNCEVQAGTEGHLVELIATGSTDFSGNTLTSFWEPTTSGWNFDSTGGVNASTEVITTKAAHGFTSGEAIYYNDEGGTANVGLTDGTKYYVNVISTTTLSLHATRAAAVGDTSRINLLASATGGENHSLYSSRAAIYQNSGGAATINVLAGGSTPSVRNGAGSSSTVLNAVTLLITVEDEAGTRIQNAQTAIYDSSGTQLMNEDTTAGGTAAESYNYNGDEAITIRVRKSSPAETRYFPFFGTGIIDSGGFTLAVRLIRDDIAEP